MKWRRPSRDPGTSGRHRAGQARTAMVHRRLWDGPARAQAERLAQAWPDWLVLYGVGSRRFYALAAWPTPEPLMVDAATSEELEARMHETVMTVATHRETPSPAPVPTALPAPQSRRGGAPSPASAVAPHHLRRPHRRAA